MTEFWYDRPAGSWVNGLPVGNGRLGAMVWGDRDELRLSVNEDTFWSGPPRPGTPDVPEGLMAAVRADLHAGRHVRAGERLRATQARNPEAPQPIGDLVLRFAGAVEGQGGSYHRELDLRTGIVRQQGAEILADAATGLLLVHLADARGIDAELTWESPQERQTVRPTGEDGLALLVGAPSYLAPDGRIEQDERAMLAGAVVRVRAEGGELTPVQDGIRLHGVREATLLLDVRTSFTGWDRPPHRDGDACLHAAAEGVAAAWGTPWAALRERHATAHAELMDRVRLRLDGVAGRADLPVDRRLRSDERDEQLAVLLFDFGRYLLLACSRPGGQPAHLQGLWNDQVVPPWRSDYTVNINTQMNYWPAEATALPECHEPLLDFVASLAQAGQQVARGVYGSAGWTVHHNTDLWRGSWPVGEGEDDPSWSAWPMGGPWLALHLAERWRFGGDEAFLRLRAWPVAAGAARFLLGLFTEDPEDPAGYLLTAPATSPENRFGTADGPASVDLSTQMDTTLARELFGFLLDTAEAAGDAADPELVKEMSAALPRLRPPAVGERGELLEWHVERPETEPHHRHASHLFGVYPGASLAGDEKLRQAARRTLELRGDASTGWSLAWKTALWARLGDGEAAHRLLGLMLSAPDLSLPHGGGVYDSLLCAHPPFQIDGNFGSTAAIAEMLVQSHELTAAGGVLRVLPALPPAWPSGEVRGLRARGGVTVERLAWEEGGLTALELRAAGPLSLRVQHPSGTAEAVLRPGEVWAVR